jgi:hypothetical protein
MNGNLLTQKKEWKTYIQEVGPQKAYIDFKEMYKNTDSYIQHTTIHEIGAIFYETKGINGIVYCDETFGFGCYHGFFGEAIQYLGVNKISEMEKICIEKFGPDQNNCQHGIGHGIMAYYEKNNLDKALEKCNMFTHLQSLIGCKNGVFMEYNFNTMSHTNNLQIRPLDDKGPYSPCISILKKDQSSCYYSLPEWWNRIYNKDDNKMGGLCLSLNETNQKSCFLGIGGVIANSTSFHPDETLVRCEKMPNQDSIILCKQGAKKIYMLHHTPPAVTEKLCNDSDKSKKQECLKNFFL